MIWFLLGGALSLSAIHWCGGGGSRRFWLAAFTGFGAFALSMTLIFPAVGSGCEVLSGLNCRAGFAALAGLSLVSTAIAGLAAAFRRVNASSFLLFALSDLMLVFSVWVHFTETTSWALPAIERWGAASLPGAFAGLLRLAAPLRLPFLKGGDREISGEGIERAVYLSLGWWQGVFLVWYVGRPGGIWLVLGGLLLWPLGIWAGGRYASLSAAGGLIAAAAAAGPRPAALVSLGLAGVAFILLAPIVGLWGLAVLPASVVSKLHLSLPVSGFGSSVSPFGNGLGMEAVWLVWAVYLPLAWSAAGSRLWRLGWALRPQVSGHPVSPGGVLASLGSIAAAWASFGYGRKDWMIWLLSGAGLGMLFAAAFSAETGDRVKAILTTRPVLLPGQSPQGRTMDLIPTLPGWAVFCVALAGFGWLVFTGLQTGFL